MTTVETFCRKHDLSEDAISDIVTLVLQERLKEKHGVIASMLYECSVYPKGTLTKKLLGEITTIERSLQDLPV